MLRRFYAAFFALLIMLLQPVQAADDDMARLYTFSSGTTIQSSQVNGEFDQLITKMNTKMSRGGVNTVTGNNTFSGNNTHSGENTFSNATAPIKTDKILEYTGAAGVTIDSVRLKDSMVKVSGTPTEGGEIGYGSNTLKYHNGTTVIDVGLSISAVTAKSGAYTAAAADDKAVHTQSGTYTVSLTAAATLGSKWTLDVRNIGTGIITIDPNSSETIDGATTIKVYQGESFKIVCDGSNFHTIGRQKGRILITSQTASSVAAVDFTTGIDSEFDEYEFHFQNVKPATDGASLYVRVSEDAGSNWQADAADYAYGALGINDAGAGTNVSAQNTTQLIISNAGIGNATNETAYGWVQMFTPANSAEHKHFTWQVVVNGTTTNIINGNGGGKYKGATTAINGVRFLMSSGNIASGTFQLFGVRK